MISNVEQNQTNNEFKIKSQYLISYTKKAINKASKMYGLLLLNMSEFIINKVLIRKVSKTERNYLEVDLQSIGCRVKP